MINNIKEKKNYYKKKSLEEKKRFKATKAFRDEHMYFYKTYFKGYVTLTQTFIDFKKRIEFFKINKTLKFQNISTFSDFVFLSEKDFLIDDFSNLPIVIEETFTNVKNLVERERILTKVYRQDILNFVLQQCVILFTPPIYIDEFTKALPVRLKKRPIHKYLQLHDKATNVKVNDIDLHNYYVVLNYLRLKIKRDLKMIFIFYKDILKVYKKRFNVFKIELKILLKKLQFIIILIRIFSKIIKLIFPKKIHKLFLEELRKLQCSYLNLHCYFYCRNYEFRKDFYFYKNDLLYFYKYIKHLHFIQKRDNIVHCFIPLYHCGFQGVACHISQYSIDLNGFSEILSREYLIWEKLSLKFQKYMYSLVKCVITFDHKFKKNKVLNSNKLYNEFKYNLYKITN